VPPSRVASVFTGQPFKINTNKNKNCRFIATTRYHYLASTRYHLGVSARLLTFALFFVVGCAPSPTPSEPVRDASSPDVSLDASMMGPSVTLGSGGRTWQDLSPEGTSVSEVVFGPQGGYHIFGRVRFRGISPDVFLSFRVVDIESGRQLTDDRDRIRRMPGRGLLQSSEGYESTSGELVILSIRSPSEVAGRRFRMEVHVVEAPAGRDITNTREFTIVDNEP
jgi:hypothetical protein